MKRESDYLGAILGVPIFRKPPLPDASPSLLSDTRFWLAAVSHCFALLHALWAQWHET